VTRLMAERTDCESVEKLWEHYHATGDRRTRNRLVLTLAPMVKYIVYRKIREIPARCEVEDFISCGVEALLRSIDRYDPERGATLEQFAWTRIHGAVIDELRRNDWAPRSVRRFEREAARTRERFISVQGRAPSHEELAAALDLTVDQLDRRLGDLQRSEVTSLNVQVLGEDDTTVERLDMLTSHDREADPESTALRDHARDRLHHALELLPERERQVAVLLYVHNLTLREIGETLGVTESRVCQLHSQLRRRLRAALAADEPLFLEVA
jgi:RNA polymerase sigma factor for flagellar operon FliA